MRRTALVIYFIVSLAYNSNGQNHCAIYQKALDTIYSNECVNFYSSYTENPANPLKGSHALSNKRSTITPHRIYINRELVEIQTGILPYIEKRTKTKFLKTEEYIKSQDKQLVCAFNFGFCSEIISAPMFENIDYSQSATCSSNSSVKAVSKLGISLSQPLISSKGNNAIIVAYINANQHQISQKYFILLRKSKNINKQNWHIYKVTTEAML